VNEEDWHITGTVGRVKFHLIKGIRSPLTCDVLLDEQRWRTTRAKEEISAIPRGRKRKRGREKQSDAERIGGGDGDEGGGSVEWT